MGLREELLRDQLYEIRSQNGGVLTPAVVVDAARPEDHPLHDRFVWDDKVAGEAFRRVQAQELIRRVRVVYREPDEVEEARSVRAFQAVRSAESPNGWAYEPVEEVALDPLKRAMLLRDMERDWQEMKRRYAHFAEFAELVRSDATVGAA